MIILFAPGAGQPSTSPWMQRWTRRLSPGANVVTFDYPYMREGRRRPDRLPVLLAAHREALSAAVGQQGSGSVVLCGKSMGARIGCHLASEEQGGSIAALICLGYPLVGARGDRRDAVLLRLRRPILFIQGTRDRLCPLDELQKVRDRMEAENDLEIVEGGDHSLLVSRSALKARGEDQDKVDERVAASIGTFLQRHGR